jgi:hypothetical protein
MVFFVQGTATIVCASVSYPSTTRTDPAPALTPGSSPPPRRSQRPESARLASGESPQQPDCQSSVGGTSRPFKRPLTNSGRMHDSPLIPQRPSAFDRVGAAGYSQDRSIEGSAGGGQQRCCRSDCGPAARSDPLLDRSGMAGETGTRSREQSPSALGLAPSKRPKPRPQILAVGRPGRPKR